MGTLLSLALAAPVVILSASFILLGQADSRANSATRYALSNASGDLPARHMPTDMETRSITNHCISGGGSKTGCVCLSTILKYEMTLRDYQAIAARTKTEERPRIILASGEKRAPERAETLDPIIKSLLRAPDFSERCGAAESFFDKQRANR